MDINKIEIDEFTQRVQRMYGRLMNLYGHGSGIHLTPEMLPQAFLELGHASEIVKLATEELYQQNEQLIETRDLVEAERQRYQELFELAPDGYLVTDCLGIIQEANYAATELLKVSKQNLLDKPMINYVVLQERQSFRSFLTQLCQGGNKVTELLLGFSNRKGELFKAAITVAVSCNQEGKPKTLRWLLRDVTEVKPTELAPLDNDRNLSQNRLLHSYCKGDTIPLDPSAIWYVHQGLVKLTTLCEAREEVLTGLVGEDKVFGSSLTVLQIYQATALSDVKLISIDLAEIAASPLLSHALLPKISQRLRQTESLLAIVGRRRVQDRFYYLLQLLQKEIGQKVPSGTRLSVRLTHEELAGACCTTRVTVTRLIGKLQKQGGISFDSKNHMIINEGFFIK